MPTKRKPAIQNISFSKLTVAEVLGYAVEDGALCEEVRKYFRYGTDLRKAYDVMMKVPSHRESIREAMGLDEGNAPPALVAQVFAMVTDEEDFVRERLNALEFKGIPLTFEMFAARAKELCRQNMPPGTKLVD